MVLTTVTVWLQFPSVLHISVQSATECYSYDERERRVLLGLFVFSPIYSNDICFQKIVTTYYCCRDVCMYCMYANMPISILLLVVLAVRFLIKQSFMTAQLINNARPCRLTRARGAIGAKHGKHPPAR